MYDQLGLQTLPYVSHTMNLTLIWAEVKNRDYSEKTLVNMKGEIEGDREWGLFKEYIIYMHEIIK